MLVGAAKSAKKKSSFGFSGSSPKKSKPVRRKVEVPSTTPVINFQIFIKTLTGNVLGYINTYLKTVTRKNNSY